MLQTITDKLDRRHMSLKEARAFVARYGVKATARTREGFIRELARMVRGE